MDGVSPEMVSQSVEAVNEILKMATQQSTEFAEKLVKMTVEMATGKELGKGGGFDAVG